jgi:hypothetical protein
MIIDKGVHMKKLIALLLVVVFSIAILPPSVSAMWPDPKNNPYISTRGTPSGDDGGWHDPTSPGGGEGIAVFDGYRIYITKYLIIYFLPKKVKQCEISIKNDLTNNEHIDRSRGSSSE